MNHPFSDAKEYFLEISIIAIPVTLESVAEYVLVFTDMAFVGRYQTVGLAAINNALMPFLTLMSLYFAIAQGATILMTQRLGGKKASHARRVAETAFFYNTLLALLYGVFWLLAGRKILELVGARGDILEIGAQYLSCLAIQFVTLGLGLAADSVLQAQNRFVLLSAVVIGKMLLNVFLDWAMIFGRCGFPEMGVAGSALATSVSSIVGDAALVFLLLRDRSLLRIRLKGVFANNVAHLRRIGRIGLPLGMEYILWMLGQTILIAMMNRVDNMVSGYFGVVNTLLNLSVYIYIGIGTANMMLVGKAVGARRPKEMLNATKYSLLFTMALCVVVGAIFLLFPVSLMSIFVKEADIQVKLAALAPLLTLIIFPRAINIVGGNSIRGMGKTTWLMATQLLGTIMIAALGAVSLFMLKWGLAGVMLAMVVEEFWRGCANLIYFYHYAAGTPA